MALGDDDYDQLAQQLSETNFDAVERDGLRAEWTPDDAAIVVRELDDETSIVYNGEDLLRATSDRELRDAREPNQPE